MSRRVNNAFFAKNIYEELEKLSSKSWNIFLLKRIDSKGYQAHSCSNHNRISFEKVKIILKNIYLVEDLIAPPGDAGCYDIRKYPQYEKIISKIKSSGVSVTQNSLKKNLFPDFEKYGLITRLRTKDGLRINITSIGKKIVDLPENIAANIFKNQMLSVYSELVEITYKILSEMGNLTFEEFMLFVNIPMQKSTSFEFDWLNKSLEMVREFRNEDKVIKLKALKIFQETSDMEEQILVNKKYKFDFGNWKNDTMQIVKIFEEIKLWKFTRNYDFELSVDQNGKRKRSRKQVEDFYATYNISKRSGFEVHHIIPFSMATTDELCALIDSFKNFIYIDGYTHAKFSQEHNPYILVKEIIPSEKVVLSSLFDEDFTLVPNENIVVSEKMVSIIKEHNNKIIKTLLFD